MVSSRTIWQSFRSSVNGLDTSSQLAGGVVFGCLIGLIPKESFVCILLILMAILTNANLLTMVVSGVVFGFVGNVRSFQELAHWVGANAFELTSLHPFLLWFFALPGVAWLRLENSIVFGALILGLGLTIPIYLISIRLFERYRRSFIQALQQKKLFRWMLGQEKLDTARGE